MNKSNIGLFLTAFAQVTLVAMNVVFIHKDKVIALIITGFLISLIWTLNVKRVAFGGWKDRFIYAGGAGLGTLFGYYASNLISCFI